MVALKVAVEERVAGGEGVVDARWIRAGRNNTRTRAAEGEEAVRGLDNVEEVEVCKHSRDESATRR